MGLDAYDRMTLMVGHNLRKIIEESLKKLSLEGDSFSVEVPHDPAHGDYATNAALVYAKNTGKNPRQLAEEIKGEIENNKPEWVQEVTIAGPGFINFTLTREHIQKNTKSAGNEDYGKNTSLERQKILIEYTDPNPFKEFHIGHLMSNSIGESVSRLLVFSGAEIKRANFQGDVGMHVAMAVWGMKKGETDSGKAYAKGATAFKEDIQAQTEIKEINKKIYEESDPEITKIYKKGRKESLARFEEIYKRLGTRFDFYIFESETGPLGVELIKKNPNVFEESDGATIYKGEKVGLHTRVFINSEGFPTYEAKDLGNFKRKTEIWDPTELVVVTGNEITDYFKVVRAAASEIPELASIADKTKHIPHGMLRLPGGKMSSRTGDVITGESLLNDVGETLKEKITDGTLLNQVSVSAIKYSMLKQEAGKDIIFDFEKSLSFTGDSGPYLQYTHARCNSLLHKAQEEGITPSDETPLTETLPLERALLHFPEEVMKATHEYSPHYIATYLHNLASLFNTFYAEAPIVEKDNLASAYKLFVTQSVKETLKKGLFLLGIEAPDKM